MPTFYDSFVACAERWPEHIGLEIQRRDRMESYSYAEIRRNAESIGRWLVENKFQPGDRCAILADNHPRWVMAYLGVIAAGCAAVPLDTALHADQVVKLLKDSGASLLFCDSKHWRIAAQVGHELPLQLVLTDVPDSHSTPHPHDLSPRPLADLDAIFAAGSANFAPVAAPADAIASLLYTSGTTGDPKGVMLTHANLLGEVDSVFRWAQVTQEDAILGVLPLFHVLSQMANLLLPLVKGARVVYLETLNTTELLRALRERKITLFAVVPQFFYLIHDRIFKEVAQRGKLAQIAFRALMNLNRSLRAVHLNAGRIFFGRLHATFGEGMRYLVTGGSRFDPKIGRDFYALGIDVLQAYGLTETTGGAFVTSHKHNVIGSVGPPLPGVEGKIVDPQPREEGGPPSGEIAIRGAIVMKGYWNRPDATAAVLRDGWLYTGDLGYFDARGNLFITGREKDVIVLSNGKNVYPEEVEAHYLQSPYIKEIAVMGLESRPGDPTSEQLHAVVIPNFDLLKQRKIVNAREVIRYDIEGLSAKLPTTKRISSYEIWQTDLPRTTTRKLKRFEIEKKARANQGKAQAEDSDLTEPRTLTEEEIEWLGQPDVQRALKVIRDAAKNGSSEIRPSSNLELDLGLDSMQRVELLVALEEELGGDLEESRLAEIYTVRELIDAVRESAAGGKTRSRAQFAGWNAVLREDPTDPEVLALIKPRPVAECFWFGVSRVIQMFSNNRFDMHINGLEKLPTSGPYLICSNHQSFIDPVVMSGYLPWPVFRDSFALGTSEIFGSGIMRVLARWLRVVVLDPDVNLVPAMRAGAFGLRHGRVLIIYPEGERSIDGTPRIFKKGAAILSIHMQAPIVPVAIDGFQEVWPRGKRFFQKFAPLKMKFGKPIIPPPEATASEASYEQLTAELKSRVVGMCNELREETIQKTAAAAN